jgi:hypothetical protein
MQQASLVSSPNFQEFRVELEPKVSSSFGLRFHPWCAAETAGLRYEPINDPLLYLSIFLSVAWEINWEHSSFAISPVLWCLWSSQFCCQVKIRFGLRNRSGAEPGFRYRGAGRTPSVDKNYIVPTRDLDVGLKNYGIWCWLKNLQ